MSHLFILLTFLKRRKGMKRSFSIILVLLLALFVAGCGIGYRSVPHAQGIVGGMISHAVTYPSSNFSHTQFRIDSNDFDIIRTVSATGKSVSILGLFASGDNGYSKLFAEARAAGADDVINIKIDTRQTRVLIFFGTCQTVLTGTAIKWKKRM